MMHMSWILQVCLLFLYGYSRVSSNNNNHQKNSHHNHHHHPQHLISGSSRKDTYFLRNYYESDKCSKLIGQEIRKISDCLLSGSDYVKLIPIRTPPHLITLNASYYQDRSCSPRYQIGTTISYGTFAEGVCTVTNTTNMISRLIPMLPSFSRHQLGVTFALFRELRDCRHVKENLHHAIAYSYVRYGSCHNRDEDLPDVKYSFCGEIGIMYEQFQSYDGSCTGPSVTKQMIWKDHCHRSGSLLDMTGFIAPYCLEEK